MANRRYRIDRSLREPQWPIRIATILILLGGAAVLVFAYSRSEWRRARTVERIDVGDSMERVVAVLGRPAAVCAAGSLEHLRGHFPPDWAAAAQDRAIEQLREQTAARWVYPLEEAEPTPAVCRAPPRGTEIGLSADSSVLWMIPLMHQRTLRLPADFAPGSLNDQPDGPDA